MLHTFKVAIEFWLSSQRLSGIRLFAIEVVIVKYMNRRQLSLYTIFKDTFSIVISNRKSRCNQFCTFIATLLL